MNMEFVELKEFDVKISPDGRVYSTVTGRPMKHSPDHHGYARVFVKLSSGKRRGLFVHRLLAAAFIPNPDNKPCVNHKNGNKSDNNLDNLEWCTHKENTDHAVKTGLWKRAQGLESKVIRDQRIVADYMSGKTRKELQYVYMVTRNNLNRILRDSKR